MQSSCRAWRASRGSTYRREWPEPAEEGTLSLRGTLLLVPGGYVGRAGGSTQTAGHKGGQRGQCGRARRGLNWAGDGAGRSEGRGLHKGAREKRPGGGASGARSEQEGKLGVRQRCRSGSRRRWGFREHKVQGPQQGGGAKQVTGKDPLGQHEQLIRNITSPTPGPGK